MTDAPTYLLDTASAALSATADAMAGIVAAMTALSESREGRQSRYAPRPRMCHGNALETHSTPSGERNSETGSTVSPTSKQPSFVVNFPLTPSESEWLRQRSRRVGEASIRFF